MKRIYKVPKRTLLLIAGIVWMIAGFNVARLGILSYGAIKIFWYNIILSAVVFLLFGTMFYKMTRKHINRIKGYEEDFRPFLNFFDLKAYIIMTIMMGGGIGLRACGVFPDLFIAFFILDLDVLYFLQEFCLLLNLFGIKTDKFKFAELKERLKYRSFFTFSVHSLSADRFPAVTVISGYYSSDSLCGCCRC